MALSRSLPGEATTDSEIEESNQALALLAEVTRHFATTLELEPSLNSALELIATRLGAEAGSLWLLGEAPTELVCATTFGPGEIKGLRLPGYQGVVGRCVREARAQRVFDVSKDPEFAGWVDQKTGMATRSLICAPMTIAGETLGAVELVNRLDGDGHFGEGELRILEVLASAAALAISNARLTSTAAEHRRFQRELQLAAEIQRGLLPDAAPESFPVHGENVPAQMVSGDFFDFLKLGDGGIAFCLGDVSGKGINAALLMAKVASLYRCLVKTTPSPGKLLGILNAEVAETASRGMFVTMVAGVLDSKTAEVVLANAGHEPVLHRDPQGIFHSIEADAPPLGIDAALFADAQVAEIRLRLSDGALYLFSDGLTETRRPDGEPLGAEGVQRLLEENAQLSPPKRVRAVMESVGRLDHRDDLTLVVVDPAAGASM